MKTVKINISPTTSQEKILKSFTINSKKLYMNAMKYAGDSYAKSNKVTYAKLFTELKASEEYKLLPSHSARRILRLANSDFKKQLKGTYNPNKKFDNPLNNTFKLLFDNERISIKDGKITLGGSKYYQQKFGKGKLEFKFDDSDYKKHREVILEPYGDGKYFRIHVTYDNIPKVEKDADGLSYEKFKGFEIGHLYHYTYDPKWKDILSFYDGKPLMIFLGMNEYGNILGINIHFIPEILRKKMMKELRFRSGDGKVLNASILKSLSVLKRFFKCIVRSYIPSHVRSKIQAISMTSDNMVSVEKFPTAKYYKKSSTEIFQIVMTECMKKKKTKKPKKRR